MGYHIYAIGKAIRALFADRVTNNFVASIMLLKESVDMEINASIWFRWM